LATAHQQSSEHFAFLLGPLAIAQSGKNRAEIKTAFLDTSFNAEAESRGSVFQQFLRICSLRNLRAGL